MPNLRHNRKSVVNESKLITTHLCKDCSCNGMSCKPGSIRIKETESYAHNRKSVDYDLEVECIIRVENPGGPLTF